MQLEQHANCLDPTVAAGPPRGGDLAVIAPAVLVRPRPKLPPRPQPKPATPAPAQVERIDYAEIDSALQDASREIAAARFKGALDFTETARERLKPLPERARGKIERLVKLEVMTATALVALGRSAAATSSFDRALELDPDLQLDTSTTPPKILRLFERVREARSARTEP